MNIPQPELAELYEALAGALDNPTEPFVRRDMDNPLLRVLARQAARSETGQLGQAFNELWDELGSAPALEELQTEHARLFLGPRAPRLQPYERVVTGQASAGTDVLRTYNEEGFGLSPDFKDLPDHVCLELEFTAHLLQAGSSDRAQTFTTAHLSPLLSRFAPRLRDETRLGFYRIVADVIRALAPPCESTEPHPSTHSPCCHNEGAA